MPFPWAAAATIGAALIGSRSQGRANQQNAALQREFAQYGIRWKVEDAKKAGLHPLYAIGAVTPSAQASYESTAQQGLIAQAGRELEAHQTGKITRRDARLASSKARQIALDQLRLEQVKARSQIHVDTAQANYYNALAASARADANNSGDGATSIESPRSEDAPVVEGIYKPKAPEVEIASKSDKSHRAGPERPAWEWVTISDDPRIPRPLRRVRMPRSDEGPFEEFLEKLPVIAAANAARYYNWLTTDEIKAMYMTPYGRLKILNLVRKRAPELLRNLTRRLRDKYTTDKAPGFKKRPAGIEVFDGP